MLEGVKFGIIPLNGASWFGIGFGFGGCWNGDFTPGKLFYLLKKGLKLKGLLGPFLPNYFTPFNERTFQNLGKGSIPARLEHYF